MLSVGPTPQWNFLRLPESFQDSAVDCLTYGYAGHNSKGHSDALEHHAASPMGQDWAARPLGCPAHTSIIGLHSET